MKKLFYFAAAAVALAACAKNEVIPVNSGENQEITFNVAPKTKADPESKKDAFSIGKVFASWAYYLPKDKTWDANSGENYVEPKEYISGAKISYNTTENVWKAEKSYYWPKDGGSLTFFAYSLNKDNFDFKTVAAGGSNVTCRSNTGIFAHIDLSVDKNVDFLVADPAKNKKSNVDEGKHFVDGVPTLFRHKLSYIIFNVKTDKNYTDAGKTLTLKSIKFNNVSYDGQYRDIASKSPAISAGFTPGAKGAVNYTGGSTESPFSHVIKSTNSSISSIDNFLYIPQDFEKGSEATKNAYIEVEYTITTSKTITNTEGQKVQQEIVTENVKKQIFLNPADGKGTKIFDKWEMGKKYTINLTFTLDEILWDPAVQDWEDVTIGTDATPIIVG